MKAFFIIITGLFLLTGNAASAQNAHFTKSGVIEYVKTVNMFAMYRKQINKDNESFYQPLYEQYIKSQPQFKKLNSTLSFDGNSTMFTPLADENELVNFYGNTAMITQNNTIFTDMQNGVYTEQKKVFEATFLVKDTARKINWKITDETREIAGFVCRRANAVVMDSIYVVAFYTEQIPVSGGPESFTGLPGMILGVALPHENITWFATKVTEATVDAKTLTPPKKGKPVDKKGLDNTLHAATKDWGSWKDAYLKAFSL